MPLIRIIRILKNKAVRYLIDIFISIYYRMFKSRTFIFQRKTYNYFYHPYNTTARNERAIEVPIIWNVIKKYDGKNILEVGNVLSHYFHFSHDTIDKYEESKDVINQDIVNFHPHKKYDLIVSISTLEHVGWDENPKDPNKILRAIKNLKSCLAKKGKIIITLPLGYNPKMDRLLKERKIKFKRLSFIILYG